jgi:hypothetical protein
MRGLTGLKTGHYRVATESTPVGAAYFLAT